MMMCLTRRLSLCPMMLHCSDEELCAVLLRHCHWEAFKEGVMKDVLASCPKRNVSVMPTSWDATTANRKPPSKSTPTRRAPPHPMARGKPAAAGSEGTDAAVGHTQQPMPPQTPQQQQ